MSEQITISFVGTQEIKSLLEKWAAEDDRSVSYILRQILEREARRRAAEPQKGQTNGNHKSETRRR
jgi:hypothetical protein